MIGGALPENTYAQYAMVIWTTPLKFFGKSVPTNVFDGRLRPFADVSSFRSLAVAHKSLGKERF